MSFELLPSLIVLTTSLSLLFRLATARRLIKEKLWVLKGIILLGLASWTIGTKSLEWQQGTLIIFSLFVFIPALVRIAFSRLSFKGNHKLAVRFAQIYLILHPSESSRTLKTQLDLLINGSSEDANLNISRPKNHQDEQEVLKYLTQLTIANRWQDIIEWTDHKDYKTINKTMIATMAPFHIRALGELGRFQDLCLYYLDINKFDIGSSYLMQLMIVSFLGDKELVNQLTSGPLAAFETDRKHYWQAIAIRFSNETGYRTKMEQLASASSASMRRAASNRLKTESEQKPQGDNVDRVLADIKTILSVRRVSQKKTKPILTYAYAIVLLLIWGIQEILGGSTSPAVLERLGAVNAYAVLAGDYWRLVTANFLHYGALHLVMNVGCLLAIGPLAEDFVGHIRYGLLIALLTCTGISTVIGLGAAGIIPIQTMVGASSVIMGIIGFELASSLRVWRQTGHREAKKRLLLWIAIVCLQTVTDFFVVQISLLAHLSGVIWGILFAQLFGRRRA
jgi:rhomboid protease GluP